MLGPGLALYLQSRTQVPPAGPSLHWRLGPCRGVQTDCPSPSAPVPRQSPAASSLWMVRRLRPSPTGTM